MQAVRGPVTPVEVTSSTRLGVRRNGTGRLASSSPVMDKGRRHEIQREGISKREKERDTERSEV